MISSLKKFTFYIFLTFSVLSIAQEKTEYSLSKVSNNKSLNDKIVILKNDTLHGKVSNISAIETLDFCKKLNNEETIQLYKDIVFNNLDCGKYKRVLTKQWSSKIVVYLDKKLPRKIIREFTKFYKSIPKIKNLDISFTKSLDKANYLITVTSEDLLKLDAANTKKDESYPFNHVTYNLLGDNNSKFYGGTLRINSDVLNDKSLIIKKLKQLFFISLGQFTTDKDLNKDSLLSYNYNNQNIISNQDFKLLKLHYLKLHDTPLNCFFYSKFIKKLQSECDYEN